MVEFWVLGYVCGIVVQVDAVSLRVGTSSLTSSYTSMEIAMFLAIFTLGLFACFAGEHLLWRLLFLGILAVACDALPFRVTIFCYLTNKLPKTVNREKAKKLSEKPNWMKNKNQTTHAGGRTGRGWQGKHYPPLRAYVCVYMCVCACVGVPVCGVSKKRKIFMHGALT